LHDLLRGQYSINCHVLPDKYFVMALVLSAGAILKWFKDTFLQRELQQAEQKGMNVYELLLQNCFPEPTHLILLPYFTGSGTPDMNPHATGVLMGLGLGSTKQEITKAIFQGIAYEIAVNLDYLHDIGIPMNEMRCVGGGANSRYWLHMKADILDRRITTLQDHEVAALGAAILAGVGVGIWNSFEEATQSIVTTDSIFEPSKTYRRYYDEQKAIYRKLYRNMYELFSDVQALLERQFTVLESHA
jgi:xylulokinase